MKLIYPLHSVQIAVRWMVVAGFITYFLASLAINCIGQYDKVIYVFTATIYFPIVSYRTIHQKINEKSLFNNLRKPEVRRLQDIINSKKSSSIYLMLFIVFLTLTLAFLDFYISPKYSYVTKRLIVSMTVCNIIYVLHEFAVCEEIENFTKEIDLKNKYDEDKESALQKLK